ncbi:MAG: hypothetical protein HZA90_17065 [Verrucomicrobia bacterium]|nr:hypothetical protein [Verrucomicrobiota bacterium]
MPHPAAPATGSGGVLPADAAAKVVLASLTPEVRAAVVRAVAAELKLVSSGMANQPVGTSEPGAVTLLAVGRLRYRPGFEDVWLGDTHYDLRERKKARLCLQYLVEKRAFDVASARHLVDEIDLYVRQQGNFPRLADIKINHYFNDQTGKLSGLRKALIRPAGRDGRYFLQVD